MLSIVYWLLFTACGMAMARWLLPEKRPVVRVWLGAALGLMLMMWLPSGCAFCVKITVAAHGLALLPLAALTFAAWLGRKKKKAARWSEDDRRLGKLLLFVALPLTAMGAYLQWTHNIMPAADGSLHVGQSTYGDLALHLSIASGLRGAAFPPDYTILPGARLSYPFLADSLSTSFMLLGFDLHAAIVFPGILMTALTFSGYVLLAARMADTKKGAVIAVLFFFLNGGLGFLYMVDMQGAALGHVGANELQSVKGLWERIKLVLNGWYQTPANHAEFTTYNLRWSNVIVDMMVPQRTTLAGWSQLIPCMYLLHDALRPSLPALDDAPKDGPTAVLARRHVNIRQMIMLGVWAGALPMVNTHCFLALGLLSLGWMIWDMIQNRRWLGRAILPWAVYGLLAVALAAPQLFTWTFQQSVGNDSFLNFRFNWVNGEQGMLDGYFWFYIKNIGLPFLLILLALLEKNEKRRFLAAGAFMIFIPAELIQFQPNPYDNNKLFYIWYMVCCVIAADYGLELLNKLKGMRAKPVIAVMAAVCCFFTGALAVAREVVSDYEAFSKADVEAAAVVEEMTAQDDVFLTGDQHLNFVSSLAGRRIVCGPDLWLYWHGFNEITAQRHWDVRRFYEDPEHNADVLAAYGVDYILVSAHERYNYDVDTAALEEKYSLLYDRDGIQIYSAGGAAGG
ncbi:MAG: hypothetical protein IJ189_11420 [Clostridia bacterium]|nr:hypothetical protein [Clostridia bacterium]